MTTEEDYQPGDDTQHPCYVDHQPRQFGGYGEEAEEVDHQPRQFWGEEAEEVDYGSEAEEVDHGSLCENQFVSGARKGEFCDRQLDPLKSKVLGLRRCGACVGIYLRQLPEEESRKIREGIEDLELSAMKELSGRTKQKQKPLAEIYRAQMSARKRKRSDKKKLRQNKRRRTGAMFLHTWAVNKGILEARYGDAANSANSDGPYIGPNPHLSRGQIRANSTTTRATKAKSTTRATKAKSTTKATKAKSTTTATNAKSTTTRATNAKSTTTTAQPNAAPHAGTATNAKSTTTKSTKANSTTTTAQPNAANGAKTTVLVSEGTKSAAASEGMESVASEGMASAVTEPEQPNAELERLREKEKEQMLEIEVFGEPKNENQQDTVAEMEEGLKSIRLKITQLSSNN